MTLRHPGISPTNDLVAKKIFNNPEITCQFIRDMLDLPAKKCNYFGGKQYSRLAFPALFSTRFLYQYRRLGGVGQWHSGNY